MAESPLARLGPVCLRLRRSLSNTLATGGLQMIPLTVQLLIRAYPIFAMSGEPTNPELSILN